MLTDPSEAPVPPRGGPSAASDAEDDDQPPPAQRVPPTPCPEPVAAVALPPLSRHPRR